MKLDDETLQVMAKFDTFADSILLPEPQAAAVLGYAANTLRNWRLNEPENGPRATILGKAVRYTVGEIRRWRDVTAKANPAVLKTAEERAARRRRQKKGGP